MAALPDAVMPFAFLLGTWRGEGVGGYPTIEADFRFGQEIGFACDGKPILTYTSRSWSVDDGRPLSRETGFWRPVSPTDLEVVVAVASGLVEVSYGRLLDGPAGAHVEIRSDVIAHTASAKQVDKDVRMYAVREGRLMWAMDMAAVGQDLQPHLSASLERVDS